MTDKILATNVHVHPEGKESVILEAGSKVPKWAEKLITNDAAYAVVEPLEAESAPAGNTAADEPGAYETWKNPELVAELKKRELPTTGKKDELVARLHEHDAEQKANPTDEESDEDDESSTTPEE